jgi:hypothetical protein
MSVRGTLPEIVRNDKNLSLGNLKHYLQVVFNHAQNLYLQYLKLQSEWARQRFPQSAIGSKLAEARELMEILRQA